MKIYNKPISNIDLIELGKSKNVNICVCMKDEFKIIPNTNFYIINLNNFGESGSHWVCVILNKYECFYFDSFGGTPPNCIHKKLIKKYKEIHYNCFIIQNLHSNMCGYYCLGLIFTCDLNNLIQSCDNYINIFNDDTKMNNNILVKLLSKI
jgi:hypothetical protein